MERFWLVLVIVVALSGPAKSQEGDIQDVILDQIAAFQADDVETAFGYASSTIHQLFSTSENFGCMVRDGYPMAWHPTEVRFLQLSNHAGGKDQRVMMRDAVGALHILEYQMVETENGWKINGVRVIDQGDLGV